MAENTNNNGAAASGKRPSEAFCELVVKKYSDVAHGLIVTEKEKAIIAGYFISIDNDYKIACINVWSVFRFVFTS